MNWEEFKERFEHACRAILGDYHDHKTSVACHLEDGFHEARIEVFKGKGPSYHVRIERTTRATVEYDEELFEEIDASTDIRFRGVDIEDVRPFADHALVFHLKMGHKDIGVYVELDEVRVEA